MYLINIWPNIRHSLQWLKNSPLPFVHHYLFITTWAVHTLNHHHILTAKKKIYIKIEMKWVLWTLAYKWKDPWYFRKNKIFLLSHLFQLMYDVIYTYVSHRTKTLPCACLRKKKIAKRRTRNETYPNVAAALSCCAKKYFQSVLLFLKMTSTKIFHLLVVNIIYRRIFLSLWPQHKI